MKRTKYLVFLSIVALIASSLAVTAADAKNEDGKNYCWTDSSDDGFENLQSQINNFEDANSLNTLCELLESSDGAQASEFCAESGDSSCEYSMSGNDKELSPTFTSNIIYVFYEKPEELESSSFDIDQAKSFNSNLIYCRFNGYETLNQCANEYDSIDKTEYGKFIVEINDIVEKISSSGESESDNEDESNSDTPEDFVAGDLYFWDAEAETGLVNSEAGSDDSANLEYPMYDGAIEGQFRWNNPEEKEYTIWMKNEGTDESAQAGSDDRYINFPPYSQSFEVDSQYDLYRLSGEGCTDFRAAILPSDWDGDEADVSSDSYQDTTFTFCPFDRDDSSDSEEDESDSKCDEEMAWSPWLEECVEKDDDVESGLAQIEDTEWSLETEDNTVHTLDDLSIESDGNEHNLMIHTGYQDGVFADHGQTGWCGNMYFETSSLESGLATFTIEMKELKNTRYGAEQDTQTPYITVDGETIFEKDDGHISPGDSDSVTVELQEGDNVKVGLDETDLGCGGYNKRTKAVIEVDADDSAYRYYR